MRPAAVATRAQLLTVLLYLFAFVGFECWSTSLTVGPSHLRAHTHQTRTRTHARRSPPLTQRVRVRSLCMRVCVCACVRARACVRGRAYPSQGLVELDSRVLQVALDRIAL